MYYSGRRWDAPMMDGATHVDEEFFAMAVSVANTECPICQEPLIYGENILLTPMQVAHVECEIRAVLGDVAHMEGRCICSGRGDERTEEDDNKTYRQSSLDAVQWMVDHNRGRWAREETDD